MTFEGIRLLSMIIFAPLVGALVLLLIPSNQERLMKGWTLGTTLFTFVVSLRLFIDWKMGDPGMQFSERYTWIPELGVRYLLGVDGISLFLVLLTTFLSPLVILFSWDVHERPKAYLALLLLMETALLGVFSALDLVLFFVFWEATLVPMYFLIGRWGSGNRVYAALKFFIYTAAGSAFMLVAILYLRFVGGSFDVTELATRNYPANVQMLGFLAFAIAFAVKVPLFPFHTWLPDAHVQAPTAGSVILAGVLLKMGTYGFLRFCLPLFPQAAATLVPYFSILAVIGILYGALVALRQKDAKSLVAYSSVAHLGFVVLGIFALNPQGINGSVLQMINHGLSTGALFLLVGMIYERRHTRLLADFGGLWAQIPIYSALFILVMCSSVGLPGLNGFVGEFMILLGTYRSSSFFAVLGTAGIILAAWYMLVLFRRMMQGPLDNPANKALKDLNLREIVTLAPILAMIVVIGLFPNIFFSRMTPSVDALLARVAPASLVAPAGATRTTPNVPAAAPPAAPAQGQPAAPGQPAPSNP